MTIYGDICFAGTLYTSWQIWMLKAKGLLFDDNSRRIIRVQHMWPEYGAIQRGHCNLIEACIFYYLTTYFCTSRSRLIFSLNLRVSRLGLIHSQYIAGRRPERCSCLLQITVRSNCKRKKHNFWLVVCLLQNTWDWPEVRYTRVIHAASIFRIFFYASSLIETAHHPWIALTFDYPVRCTKFW